MEAIQVQMSHIYNTSKWLVIKSIHFNSIFISIILYFTNQVLTVHNMISAWSSIPSCWGNVVHVIKIIYKLNFQPEYIIFYCTLTVEDN